MRISIQAYVEAEGTRPSKKVALGEIEHQGDLAPASGMGLFIAEAHSLLKQLQALVLNEQVDQFIELSARCLACGAPLGLKDTKRLVYRTAFGKVRLRSPRFYAHCSACGFCSIDKATMSPLANALPQRVHPQWSWLQCRYASVMSYRLAQIFLRDEFPGGSQLPASSVKANVRFIGDRLEQEALQAARVTKAAAAPCRRPPLSGPPIALQIDAGYIKAPRQLDGSRWIPVIASKIFNPDTPHTHAHAYATVRDPGQGLRQQAFLKSIGFGLEVPVTVLSDGGDDIAFAYKLPSATARVLDWFHIGMRFEHLLMSLPVCEVQTHMRSTNTGRRTIRPVVMRSPSVGDMALSPMTTRSALLSGIEEAKVSCGATALIACFRSSRQKSRPFATFFPTSESIQFFGGCGAANVGF